MQTSRHKRLKLVKSSETTSEDNSVSTKKHQSQLTLDEYYEHAEQYAQQIRKTHDVSEIIGILNTVLSETQDLRHNSELSSAQEQIRYAEQKIESLRHELELIRELVHNDQMTGLLNRRGLEELYAREAARADRNQSPLCAILIDLDDFEEINEVYGYPFGDKVLIHFSKQMKRTLRPSDVIARYSGKAFIILLPDTGIAEAVCVLQRLQQTLVNRPILSARHQPIPVTFSSGVTLRQPHEHLQVVIKRAEEALVRAKNSGKSQIEIYS